LFSDCSFGKRAGKRRFRRARRFEVLQFSFERSQTRTGTLADYLFATLLGQSEGSFARRHFGEETIVSGRKLGAGGGFLTGSLGSQRLLAPFSERLTPRRCRGDKALLVFGRNLPAECRRGLVPGLP